jgi:aspartate-semialdehyde dehydrogenase
MDGMRSFFNTNNQEGEEIMAEGIGLAVVGATGAVGQEMIKVLAERKFPVSKLVALAAPEEAGTPLQFRGETILVEASSPEAFAQSDAALFAVEGDVSRKLAPIAKENHCVVIDNSNAFRLDPDVPLVVPEVNPEDVNGHKGLIANPNCSTTIMVVAINPIHQAVGIERVIVSTYQAVSGAGILGIDELRRHAQEYLQGVESQPVVFKYPIAFNLIPHIDVFVEDDYTKEEMKMVYETQKILHVPDMKIVATTVRVPVFRSHSESVNLDLKQPMSPDEARALLAKAPGIILQDDPSRNFYPMPRLTSDTDEVYVGRIRRDISTDKGLALWVVSDQIRKGAATNCIQIAELLLQKGLLSVK